MYKRCVPLNKERSAPGTWTAIQRGRSGWQSHILHFYHKGLEAVNSNVSINKLIQIPALEKIGRAKYIRERYVTKEYDAILAETDAEIDELIKEEADEL